jgi:hypothetical protein
MITALLAAALSLMLLSLTNPEAKGLAQNWTCQAKALLQPPTQFRSPTHHSQLTIISRETTHTCTSPTIQREGSSLSD